MFKKYRKVNNCSYPFSNEPLGYCWGYANHVDGVEKFKDLEKLCKKCEFNKGSEHEV